ncbi:hypothetical protein HHL24_20610 [Paraburkholderia sp. RP-4-7]|jgi:hypothetical protein|uniref:Uncharacterized protein n=1 Tax=Paraburkholderia polaris TaxID=2728848 RepID=A0A848IFD4_9BURK|nr:hypothetical protein [Paraburkholderia polaris]NMM00331.1 hypothetical protein [Paraburkholderia polaris]
MNTMVNAAAGVVALDGPQTRHRAMTSGGTCGSVRRAQNVRFKPRFNQKQ